MPEPLRVLVVGAHPADVFDQSGGTMAHHAARGDWVGCIVLTHGARVHDRVIATEMHHRKEVPTGAELAALIEERTAVKNGEVRRALESLGVTHVEFFGADDAILLPDRDLIRRLANSIRELKPNVIITHFPKEDGGVASPHAVTGQMVMHAIHFAGGVDGTSPLPPHRVAQVYFFGSPGSVRVGVWRSEGGYTCDVLIDITDVIEKKLATLDMLDSQGYAGAYARKRIETNDGAFGNYGGVSYAEGFISLNSVTCYYLPVAEINLENSRKSDQEAVARRSWRTPSSCKPAPGAPAAPPASLAR